MNKQTLKKKIKDVIAGIAWKILLWSIGMTAEQYWTEIYREERNKRCIQYSDDYKKDEKE